jgi:hypothetical protein
MSVREIRRCIRHIAKDWSRRLSFEQVKAQLGVTASVRTIRRELRRAGLPSLYCMPKTLYITQASQETASLCFGTQVVGDIRLCRTQGRWQDWRGLAQGYLVGRSYI